MSGASTSPTCACRRSWLYLVAVLDWYARYVVAWELDQTLELGFVLEAVERALTVGCPTIWNSDQGSHFTSPQYLGRLEARGIQISMDGKGRALDNVFTERLWRTVKYEEVYLQSYATPREARQSLARYFAFYNHERPHQALGYRTPAALAAIVGDGNGVPLRSVARVHRGVATGDNGFFVLSRQEAAARELLPWCRPAITRAEEILSADGVIRDTPERRLLLVAPRDVDRRAHPALDAYLRSGEQPRTGKPPVAEGYLASHRKPWWYLGPVAAPAIVASYMARQAPAFAYNPDGLVLLNIAHGLYPHQPLSAAQLMSLVQELNAARHTFSGHGRTYQGGLEKFEPREMEELSVHLDGMMNGRIS